MSTFSLKFYNFSSYDFSHVLLPLSSSFSSCNFLMSTLSICLVYALFFLQISTLCLYPFWKSFSSSNSSYNTSFSFPPKPICSSKYSPPKSNSPYSDSQSSWPKITQLFYMLSFFYSYLLLKLWCTCLCRRILRFFCK